MSNQVNQVVERKIEIRGNHAGPGFLLVAVEKRTEGFREEILTWEPLPTATMAKACQEVAGRLLRHITGVGYDLAP